MSSSVLTWGADPGSTPLLASERLRALERSHHAMWNYLTYRDAIGIVGLDPATLYPGGTTRLDPATWADLGWLTCFAGPPPSAVRAMREAVTAEHLNQYSPDLIEPLRDAAAGVLGRARDEGFEVIGTEGAQAGIALSLMAVVGPGDEVILSDPGYFHVPSAVIATGATPVTVSIDATNGYRLDPDVVAAAITPRTRAIVIVDPLNPYGTVQSEDELAALARLADEHDLLLIHDVTHGSIVIDRDAPFRSLPALELTENAVATFSVSHCYGMAGARIGFLGGPSRLMRSCLRLKAALTRLNTSLVAQHGALAALRDEGYLAHAEAIVRRNLAHLQATLSGVDGIELATAPVRGLACALDTSGAGVTAQELMVALFARHVATYPGDGMGTTAAATTLRLNLSRPDPWAMEHLRAMLPEAIAEAGSGRWREPVAALLESKATPLAIDLAATIRGRR
ncbi:MAG TPA: pyridoxal phosphate-dependent aminotransferase [Solirubrobacteraceae bacterium]|nr:pyridoxal phosphate-dependent aminotransferase [Solirubrobacteraceae bacterium]